MTPKSSLEKNLSLNPNTKNPRKIVRNLLAKEFKVKKEVVVWHDILNNSISRHDSNNFRASPVTEKIEVLKNLLNTLSALVYCHGSCSPDIFEQLKGLDADLDIKVFNIVRDFISPKKQEGYRTFENFQSTAPES